MGVVAAATRLAATDLAVSFHLVHEVGRGRVHEELPLARRDGDRIAAVGAARDGRLPAGDRPVALDDVRAPVLVEDTRTGQGPTAAALGDPAGQEHAAGDFQVDLAPGSRRHSQSSLEDQVRRAAGRPSRSRTSPATGWLHIARRRRSDTRRGSYSTCSGPSRPQRAPASGAPVSAQVRRPVTRIAGCKGRVGRFVFSPASARTRSTWRANRASSTLRRTLDSAADSREPEPALSVAPGRSGPDVLQ